MAQLRLPKRRKGAAFVLSGGGNLGALQVGMLRALCERDIRADVVFGCSVGALNGAGYAAAPDPDGVTALAERWTALGSDASSVMPSSVIPNPVQLIRRGEALHDGTGLRATVEAFLGAATRFEDLALPFECVATDVERGVEHWFRSGPLIEPILASAALPAVYPMVTVDGRRYLDGGAVDNVPVERAVEWGARTIYVLHCGLHGRPNQEVRRPIDAALIAYWISRNHRLAHDLARVPEKVDVVVLQPSERPDVRFDDFTQSAALIEMGRVDASRYLDELAAADAAADQDLGDRLRQDLRRLVDDLRGRVGSRAESAEPSGSPQSGESRQPTAPSASPGLPGQPDAAAS